jgi:hypothetical protein
VPLPPPLLLLLPLPLPPLPLPDVSLVPRKSSPQSEHLKHEG